MPRSRFPLVLLVVGSVLTTLLGAQAPVRANGPDGGGSGRAVPAPVWQGEPGRHPGGLLPSGEPLPHRLPPASGTRDAAMDRAEGPPRGATYFAPTTPLRWGPGDRADVPVTVTDTGRQPWRAQDIALGVRWYRPDGSEYTYRRGERPVEHLAALPEDLAPGESAEVRADVRAPSLPGSSAARTSLFLAWDLYDRRSGTWLSEVEPPTARVGQARERVVVERPGSDHLGLERFYQYTRAEAGVGAGIAVNAAGGNAATSWNLFAHPSLGPAAFLRLTHNTQDASDTVAGPGWSVSASTLTRLGSPLHFAGGPHGVPGFPKSVHLIDGDGTGHTFRLDRHGSADSRDWDYAHPAGVHFHLQRTRGVPDRRWVFTRPDRTQFFFSAQGRPTAVVDRNGNTLRFHYGGGDGFLVPPVLRRVTDASGRRVLTLEYGDGGDGGYGGVAVRRLVSVTDVHGRRVEFSYGRGGSLREVTDAAGSGVARSLVFAYDRSSDGTPRLTGVTDPKGGRTRIGYEERRGQAGSRTAAVGAGSGAGAAHGRVTTITDRLGGVTRLDRTAGGHRDGSAKGHDDRGAKAQAGVRGHDDRRTKGRWTTVTDATGERTAFRLDGFGRAVESRNAKGEATRLAWDADNNVRRLEEPGGAVTTWRYDQRTGYPLEITGPLENAQDPEDRASTGLTYRTALRGHVADLVEKVSPEGRRWTFGVDGYGNVVSVTDPRGNTGEADGKGAGSERSRGPRRAPYTSYNVYDDRGRLLESTDPRGHATRFAEYGPTGHPARAIDALGHRTRFRYDAVGAVTAVTDAKGRTSRYEYDLLGRPLGAVLPRDLGAEDEDKRWIRVPAPAYDANDNVVRAIDPNDAVTTATYNAADRLLSVTDPRDTPDGPQRTTRYAYDRVGNRVAATTPRGHRSVFLYDELHRLIETTDPLQGRTTYVYDRAGNVASVTRPRTNAKAEQADRGHSQGRGRARVRPPVPDQRFTYDLAHQISAVTDAEGNVVRNGYDRDGHLISVTDQCGATTRTRLDAVGAPVEIRAPHRLGDERRFDCSCPEGQNCEVPEERTKYRTTRYAYDEAGNRTKIFTPRSVAENDEDLAQETVYDALNRVSEQLLPHDPKDPDLKDRQRVTNVYDEVGQLTEVHTPPSGKSTDRSVTRHTYFDDGLLRRSTDPWQIRTDYSYDPVGNQISRTLTGDGGGANRTMSWEYYPDGKLRRHRDSGTPASRETVLTDNSDTGRTTPTGRWTLEKADPDQNPDVFGTDYHTHPAEDRSASFAWNLAVPSDGTYRVLARWPHHDRDGKRGGRGEFVIPHEDGRATTVAVDQSTASGGAEGGGGWRELGRFAFKAGEQYAVTLAGAEETAGRLVLADAVELVRTETEPGAKRDAADDEAREYHYGYDPDGLVTRIAEGPQPEPSRTWTVTNDPLGRPSAVEERARGDETPRTAQFTYDPDGNLTDHQVTAAGRDPETSHYTYNTLGLLSKALTKGPSTDGDEKKTTFTWWPTGRINRQTKDNGNTVDHWHYLDGALAVQEEKKDGGGGALVSRHEIDYDPDGNRTRDASLKMDADDHGRTLDTVATYTYDARNRSTEVKKVDGNGGPDRTETYRYDQNNNVVEQEVGGVESVFDFDRDRLLSSTAGGVASSYLYDVYGRLSQVTTGGDPAQKNVYDGFDRLIEHRTPKARGGPTSLVTRHTYDAFDRRTSTTTDAGGGDKERTTDFHYLGLGEQLLTEEKDGKLSKAYQYGPAGERLSQVTFDTEGTKDPDTVFFGYGPHNDVEHVTDDSGDTKATYGYTAYGQADEKSFTGIDKPSSSADPTSEPFNFYRFNSRRWDGGSGTYDMGFRDYNPGLNQFLSRDMYNGALSDLNLSTDPWTQNRYGFAGGNPISNVELDGHLFGMSWSEIAHTVLDVVGMVPVVGEIADVANGVLYLAEGNYVEAGLSLSSAIPVVGNAIGAANLARKAGKLADEAVDAGQALNKGGKADNAGAAGTPGTPGSPAQARTPEGESRAPSRKPEGASCPLPSSFVPGTRVLMADGATKPIEAVRKGDRVMAAQPGDERPLAREVTATITSAGEKELVRVTVDTDGAKGDRTSTLTATGNHPFWVRNTGRWTKAVELAVGQWLRTSAGTYVQVAAVEGSRRSARVHNLTVRDAHTYYVLAGETPVLVHNSNPCGPLEPESVNIAQHSAQRAAAGDGSHYVRGIDPRATAEYVDGVLTGDVPNLQVRYLKRGRVGYWDPDKGAVVIEDPSTQGGTVFTPKTGKKYFDELE
ncbi:golvesin C-terminal-like domain-containing protein [Streptomyces caniscabiei]|uniref:golvesin C-terminal-like domain-containing protein n=1 Tax=Streptomyces caniscabiei TaxID=2746961 RepID=UPI0038F79B79